MNMSRWLKRAASETILPRPPEDERISQSEILSDVSSKFRSGAASASVLLPQREEEWTRWNRVKSQDGNW
ncbi:hypothetical protein H6P81_019271 [Aristolochia fimbriata]|uniref:Uncharacterized protein n=1 Tax=Aristolochia fimbriata TaxID=158543 RepID=A0AAV7DU98_ARIFI|nr:hypothetical protein H6P81_019271 [Aristolochia fimbriata]